MIHQLAVSCSNCLGLFNSLVSVSLFHLRRDFPSFLLSCHKRNYTFYLWIPSPADLKRLEDPTGLPWTPLPRPGLCHFLNFRTTHLVEAFFIRKGIYPSELSPTREWERRRLVEVGAARQENTCPLLAEPTPTPLLCNRKNWLMGFAKWRELNEFAITFVVVESKDAGWIFFRNGQIPNSLENLCWRDEQGMMLTSNCSYCRSWCLSMGVILFCGSFGIYTRGRETSITVGILADMSCLWWWNFKSVSMLVRCFKTIYQIMFDDSKN